MLTPKTTPYIPHSPTPRQAAFLLLDDVMEILYGGAAGGGKSDALLMAALQYVDTPGYAALILRRSYADLALPGAIMDRSKEWLHGTDARWSETEKTWHFPAGASVTFGYLEHATDQYRYQSAEFQFVGFDELTQFNEPQYRYLFSRIRRPNGLETGHPLGSVPLRMRAASNPGGPGHEWVKQRFIVEGGSAGRLFIPAKLADNPYLDQDEYLRALSELDPVTRQQLLDGNWDVMPEGTRFRREWFRIVESEEIPAGTRWVRYWDMAATEPKPGEDPDYTAGVLMGRTPDGQVVIGDIVRFRASSLAVEQRIANVASQDGRLVPIRMEQEPGSSGKSLVDHYRRTVLFGYNFDGVKTTGPKEVRAGPLAAAAEAGNLLLVRGEWIGAFIDEAVGFGTPGIHDDQVDAASGAMEFLRAAIPPASGEVKPLPSAVERRSRVIRTPYHSPRRGRFGVSNLR